MHDPEDRALQERIIAVALPALQEFGFAIAGGHVLRLHGILDRPSEDVDFFTNQLSIDDFLTARGAVITALHSDGLKVELDPLVAERFARIWVTTGELTTKLELGYDWRSAEPTLLAVGPVLSRADSVATKTLALWGRAAAKDAIDVNAYLESGEFSKEEILHLAQEHDAGFLPADFARSLRQVAAWDDSEYRRYGISPRQIAAIKAEMTGWAHALLFPPSPRSAAGRAEEQQTVS